jgi:flagellar protein FlaF
MAVAEIVGAAIGVLLLIVVAYLLVGGTLSTAETVITAQKDITLLTESRLRTSIDITSVDPPEGTNLNFTLTNNGDEIVNDLSHMDVFSYDATNGYLHYTYDSEKSGAERTWSVTTFETDTIHTGELDPGDTMRIQAIFPAGVTPLNVQVTTSNGVSAVSSV